MGTEIRELLDLPVWRAFDIDDAGRILAGHDASGSIQLVELAPDGTATELTALPGACYGRYLPGRRAVVVEHDQGGDEKRQLSLLPLDPAPAAPAGLDDLVPLVRDERHFHNLADVAPGRIVYTTNRRNNVDFDVVVRDVDSGTERVVYDGGGYIADVAVAPGGDSAVLLRCPPVPMSEQLVAIDAEGNTRDLTAPDMRAQHTYTTWVTDPDGHDALIVTTDREREFTVVARLEPESGVWTELVAAEGRDVAGWPSPDGRLIAVLTNEDGVARMSVHDGRTGDELRAITLPDDGWVGAPFPAVAWSPGSRYMAVSFSSPVIPGDVLQINAETGEVATIARSTGPLAGTRLARPESHRVPSPDGEQIPCYLYRGAEPADPRLAGSAVVIVHGGPESQSVCTWNPFVQALAGAGHAVLVPNVRGSSGYGKRWYSADDVRRRLDSVADLAALHAWLPSQGLDPRRAALWGGSYGGYMVLAGVAFQPELWAAGVDIVGISSLVTFLQNTSAYRRSVREREYGSVERDLEFLESASPINRVDDIRAPLFVIHGANDPRVPLSEAEQLVAALRQNGVECELHVYADEGHGLVKRVNRLDAYPKATAFIARHLAAPEA
jgi:dipeptidyl aminopeptidase/acylaminoacyl peptidase